MVLLDGVEINDAGTPGGGFDFSSIDSEMIERIEIYKGPQSLRFGSGAIGGVINIVSKKGQGPFELIARARAGSFQTNQVGLAAMNGNKKWNYSLAVSRFESAGISASSGGNELDGHRRVTSALRTGAQFGKTELLISSRFVRNETELDYAPAGTPPFLVADDPNYHSTTEFMTNALHAKTVWNSTFDSQFTLARHDLKLDFLDPADAANPSRFAEKRSAATFKFENVNTWKPREDLQVVFGPSHRREKAAREMSITGFFAGADYTHSSYFLNLGERVDHHSRFGSFFSHQIAPGYRAASLGSTFKARYATAFKSPSLFQLYAPSFGNPDLRPEQVRGYELAWVQEFGTSQMLSLTGFQYESSALIQFGARYENVRSSRARGFELEYAGEISARWNIEAGYTYTDARRLDTNATLLRRPFHAWNAGTSLRFGGPWEFHAHYHGKGGRADIDAVTAAPNESAGYDLLNLGLKFWPATKTSLGLNVENLFGRRYEEISGYGAPGMGLYLDIKTEI